MFIEMILRLIPFVIASLLLGAHFLRQGSLALVLVAILAPLFLLIRKRLVLTALQLWSYAAAAIWLHTTVILVHERTMLARPWGVAVIILGSVALFTIGAGALLNSRSVREKYKT
jgi:hypothetical protein